MTQDCGFTLKLLRRSLGVLGVVLAAGPLAANAQGWYVGAGVGQTKAKDFEVCSLLFDPGSSCSDDDSDTGIKVFAGNQLNSNVAFELNYTDLGSATSKGSGTIFGFPAAGTVEWEGKGFGVDVVGTAPISPQFGFIGRLGLFLWDVELSASGLGGSFSDSDSGTAFTYGVGVAYQFGKSAGLRVEWQVYNDIGDDSTTGQSDVDMLSASLVFHL